MPRPTLPLGELVGADPAGAGAHQVARGFVSGSALKRAALL